MDDGPAADPGRDPGADADGEPSVDAEGEPVVGSDGEPAGPDPQAAVEPDRESVAGSDGAAATGNGEPPPGLVTVRGAIYGVALLWLAAMAGFGAVQAAVYGATTATPYLLLAAAAAALSLTAGYASLRAFGLK